MPIRNIEDLKLDEITEDMLRDQCIAMGESLGVDTSEGSIYRDASEGHIIRSAKFFDDLRRVKEIISIKTCTGDILEEKMTERSLQFNPPEDTSASYYVDFVGAVPQIGALMSCDDHFFNLSKIGERYVIVSQEKGTEMNSLTKGLPVIPDLDVDDLISATLGELAVPAVDQEADDPARERYLAKLAGPAENGNDAQVQSWCESVAGVGRARIIPKWNGATTVKGIIISTAGGIPEEAVVEAVQDYIDPGGTGMGEGAAAIGVHFTAEAAEALNITVNVTVTLIAGADIETVKSQIKEAIEKYFAELSLSKGTDTPTVRSNYVSMIFSANENITDFFDFKMNGAENYYVQCKKSEIPVLSSLSIETGIRA